MLRALIAGETSAEAMADLARGRLRRKRADLILALDGRLEEHHRFLLTMQLRRLEAIEADIAALDLRIDERLEPYRAPHTLLMQISGVDWVVAAVLIAEIGVDMSVFVSVYHLSAWAASVPATTRAPAGRRAAGLAGQYPPPRDPGRRRDLRLEDQGQLPQGQVPPPQGPPRRFAPPSPSPTRSSSPPITCSLRTWPTAISARPTRPDRPIPNRRQPQTPPRTPRLSRHPRTQCAGHVTPTRSGVIFVAATRKLSVAKCRNVKRWCGGFQGNRLKIRVTNGRRAEFVVIL